MKKLLSVLLLCLGAAPLWAQTAATTGSMDFEAERARLAEERKAVDARHAEEQAHSSKRRADEAAMHDSAHAHRDATA